MNSAEMRKVLSFLPAAAFTFLKVFAETQFRKAKPLFLHQISWLPVPTSLPSIEELHISISSPSIHTTATSFSLLFPLFVALTTRQNCRQHLCHRDHRGPLASPPPLFPVTTVKQKVQSPTDPEKHPQKNILFHLPETSNHLHFLTPHASSS